MTNFMKGIICNSSLIMKFPIGFVGTQRVEILNFPKALRRRLDFKFFEFDIVIRYRLLYCDHNNCVKLNCNYIIIIRIV